MASARDAVTFVIGGKPLILLDEDLEVLLAAFDRLDQSSFAQPGAGEGALDLRRVAAGIEAASGSLQVPAIVLPEEDARILGRVLDDVDYQGELTLGFVTLRRLIESAFG